MCSGTYVRSVGCKTFTAVTDDRQDQEKPQGYFELESGASIIN
jgi:hypothetical protein